jgi:sulfur carrier protein ThiS
MEAVTDITRTYKIIFPTGKKELWKNITIMELLKRYNTTPNIQVKEVNKNIFNWEKEENDESK